MGAFKAYDIRGVYGKDFDADTVYRIGREIPGLLGAECVLVGRDARVSSPEIFEALARGITDSGADVDYLGLCTTPMTYYFTGLKNYEAAVMITASHNPKEYNGLKISRRGALPVGEDSGLKELEKRVRNRPAPPADKRGVVRDVDYKELYVEFLKKNLSDLSGLKICVDCSNGMSSLLVRDVFAGADVSYLYDTVDGTFPNHSPNPLEADATLALKSAVREKGADIGVIFDADADRVMFVDENARFVRPDLMIAVLAEHYLKREPGAAILCDIRTSRGVTEAVERLGGHPHIWKVGHAFAKVKLRELNAIVGGELAGHYYFRDFFNCDSAMLCADIVLGVVAAAVRNGGSFSRLLSRVDVYANTGECNYTVEKKTEAMEALRKWAEKDGPPVRKYDFDGLRLEWNDGWINVRPSNTEPYLRVVAEAASEELLKHKKAGIDQVLAGYTVNGKKNEH